MTQFSAKPKRQKPIMLKAILAFLLIIIIFAAKAFTQNEYHIILIDNSSSMQKYYLSDPIAQEFNNLISSLLQMEKIIKHEDIVKVLLFNECCKEIYPASNEEPTFTLDSAKTITGNLKWAGPDKHAYRINALHHAIKGCGENSAIIWMLTDNWQDNKNLNTDIETFYSHIFKSASIVSFYLIPISNPELLISRTSAKRTGLVLYILKYAPREIPSSNIEDFKQLIESSLKSLGKTAYLCKPLQKEVIILNKYKVKTDQKLQCRIDEIPFELFNIIKYNGMEVDCETKIAEWKSSIAHIQSKLSFATFRNYKAGKKATSAVQPEILLTQLNKSSIAENRISINTLPSTFIGEVEIGNFAQWILGQKGKIWYRAYYTITEIESKMVLKDEIHSKVNTINNLEKIEHFLPRHSYINNGFPFYLAVSVFFSPVHTIFIVLLIIIMIAGGIIYFYTLFKPITCCISSSYGDFYCEVNIFKHYHLYFDQKKMGTIKRGILCSIKYIPAAGVSLNGSNKAKTLNRKGESLKLSTEEIEEKIEFKCFRRKMSMRHKKKTALRK
jgi:hypothetical protein